MTHLTPPYTTRKILMLLAIFVSKARYAPSSPVSILLRPASPLLSFYQSLRIREFHNNTLLLLNL